MGDIIKDAIRTIPDWPKPGIMFRDITTLLKDEKAFKHTIDRFAKHYVTASASYIAGIESRGFIIGAALAYETNRGFIPIRKPGKLPGETISEEYSLEYGTDQLEIHADALGPSDRVIVVDDLIATGGTAIAACNLVERLGASVAEFAAVVDLPDLGGKQKIIDAGYKAHTLVDFEGE